MAEYITSNIGGHGTDTSTDNISEVKQNTINMISE